MSDTNTKLGSILKEERERKNISQDDIADALNVTRTSVSKRESGKVSISVDELIIWCEAIGIDELELIKKAKKEKKEKGTMKENNKDQKEFLDNIIKLADKLEKVYYEVTNEKLSSKIDRFYLTTSIECGVKAFDIPADKLLDDRFFSHDVMGIVNNIDVNAIQERCRNDNYKKPICEYATEDDFNFFVPRISSYIDGLKTMGKEWE